MDAALRLLQAGVLLLALAFLGWELAALTSLRPAPPEVLAAIDEGGNGSVRIYEQRRGGVRERRSPPHPFSIGGASPGAGRRTGDAVGARTAWPSRR